MLSELKQMTGSTIVSVCLSLIVVWSAAQLLKNDIDDARNRMIERHDKVNERIDAIILELIDANILKEPGEPQEPPGDATNPPAGKYDVETGQ